MNSDTELLREYVEQDAESAFTRLVHEHLNLVYSAALRETAGDGAQAEDISQAVFSELARKAPRLLKHPSLAGWLYITVRHVASNLRRSEQRRRVREEKAQVMNELLADSPDLAWERLRPVIDDVLHELNETDREVIVLRFLKNQSLRDVGAALGVQENTARMRVERALEKLRGLLAHRGITSTAGSLTAALAIGVITPAPSSLGATIAAAALASGAVTTSTSLTIIKLMTMSKAKLCGIGALVVAGVAVPVWQQTRLQTAQAENAQLLAQEKQLSGDQSQLAALRAEAERLRGIETNQAELERLRQYQAETQPELLRLRGMAGVARRANLEAEQLRAKIARDASENGTNLISGAMADAMKQAMEQQVEGRLSRMAATLHLTPEQTQAARDILMRQANVMSASVQQVFSGKYSKDDLAKLGKDAGNPEEQIKAILSPEQKASYQQYQQEEAAYNARQAANMDLLQLQSTLGLTSEQEDRAFAALYEVSFNQLTGTAKPATTNQADGMVWVLDQKAKALEPILTPEQSEKYHQQRAVQAKLVKDIWSKMNGGSK